jgi:hypothetical protein
MYEFFIYIFYDKIGVCNFSSGYALRHMQDNGKERESEGIWVVRLPQEVHLTILFVSRKYCNQLRIDAASYPRMMESSVTEDLVWGY